MIQWNNKLIRINGGLCEYHEPPAPPFVQYNYTTFKPRSGYTRLYWDPAGGTFKYFDNSYSRDLTAGTSFQTNGGSGDWPNLTNLDSTHLYEFVWADEDIRSSWPSGSTSASYGNDDWDDEYPTNVFGELYSLDFLWGYSTNSWFKYVTIIPQDARNIHRGEYLVNCEEMFKNAPITNSIEAFIIAMRSACPNIEYTSGCFEGCTTAPDYSYCLTNYPEWF